MRSSIIVAFVTLCISESFSQPLCDFRGRDSLQVVVSGDTVSIWDMAACGYCAMTFVVSVSRSADSVYIFQADTSHVKATCACIYDLRTSIVGLPSGTYWAVINRDYGPPGHIQKFVGSIRFQYVSTSPVNLASKTLQSGCIPVSIPEKLLEFPSQFALLQNYPNPFNPRTTLRYQTTTTEHVSIKVFDMLGRQLQTLVEESKPPGFYVVSFEAPAQASSGIYFCQMVAGSFVETRLMVLLR